MSRRPASIVLSVVFGVLALVAWGQVLVALLHFSDEVPTVNVLHTCIGFAGAGYFWSGARHEAQTKG